MELQGTPGADTLTGGADNDTLYGYAGNDILKGGAGDDVLAGNEGADSLQGGDGDDYLLGGPGNDTLDGGAGGDWAAYEDATAAVKVDLSITIAQNTGGGGTDKLIGIEHVYGSAFNDTLIGNAAANMMVGGEGNDVVSGGKGDDTLWGSAGNDTLDGGDGDDYLVGGAGDDIVKGGAGWDWSSYEDATAGVTVDLNKTNAQNTGGGGTDTLSGVEHLYGTKFNDTLTGDAKDNYLWGDAGDDSLYGGVGDDHLSGGAGNNWISGGDGFDTVDYAFSDKGVTINLNMGAPPMGGAPLVGDWLTSIEAAMGSAYDDEITGNASENYLFGDAGDDQLYAVGGNDTLDGGDGDDYLVGGANSTSNLLIGGAGNDSLHVGPGSTTIDGGDGDDWLHVSPPMGAAFLGMTIDLRITGDQEVVSGVHVTMSGVENASGGAGNDHLIGDAKDNVLLGGSGDDLLDGGAGSDTASYADDGLWGPVVVDLGKSVQALSDGRGTDTYISIENVIGSFSDDTITGDAGANRLNGYRGNDRIYAIGGNDILEGDSGDDLLVATIEGPSNDKLYGGVGDDRLVTNKAAALLDGGDGNDVFDVPHVASMAGTVMIDGGAGVDTLDMSGAYGAIANLTIDLSVGGKQDVGQGQFLDIKGVENVIGGFGDDKIKGDAGDNVMIGNGGYNILDGGDGMDLVSYADGGNTGVHIDLRNTIQSDLGGRGTDVLISIEGVRGTAYDDVLIGNDKDNLFIGGAGDDIIDGGAGVDTVSYKADGAIGGVYVDLRQEKQYTDSYGTHGNDRLISIENVIGSSDNDVIIGNDDINHLWGGVGNDDMLAVGYGDTLDGGDGDDHLQSGYSAILIGGAGNDYLQGGDKIDGGAGNDRLEPGYWSGAIVVHGGEGVDTILFDRSTLGGATIDLSKTGSQAVDANRSIAIEGVENIIGSGDSDVLIGDAGDNVIDGNGGYHDIIKGGAGNDRIIQTWSNGDFDGGDGVDTVDYNGVSGPVVADLVKGLATTERGSDTLKSIENLIGSHAADQLTGDANANVLDGNDGDDVLNGGAGDDVLIGGWGQDTLTGGAGADIFKFLGEGPFRSNLKYVDVITDFGAGDKMAFLGAPSTVTFADIFKLADVTALSDAVTATIETYANQHLDGTLSQKYLIIGVGADTYVIADTNSIVPGYDQVVLLKNVVSSLVTADMFMAA